ncbi:MAG TPA: hypothetical protein VM845_11830, partial [Burkholderiaceae bacterium]|nr:hypothetical protein [Burkholderiaceae bacterium]
DGRVIEVRNPFTREIVGTVPKASLAQVREAFEIGRAYKPKLSRAPGPDSPSAPCRRSRA